VITDPAPNSFGVGTRPETAIVGVTTGLADHLSRDELEAVLAYEVSRIRSWDVASSSWTVASRAVHSPLRRRRRRARRSSAGYLGAPRSGSRYGRCATRATNATAAVRFTRNPGSLVRALEKLDADGRQVGKVSRSTAPLWIEFPPKVLEGRSTRATRRLAASLLLDERIADLRELAHAAPDPG
jgi:Zn-dependent protease with chaperone function